MLTKIIQTIFSKGIISIINFLVVLITARYLGADGRGEISILFLKASNKLNLLSDYSTAFTLKILRLLLLYISEP